MMPKLPAWLARSFEKSLSKLKCNILNRMVMLTPLSHVVLFLAQTKKYSVNPVVKILVFPCNQKLGMRNADAEGDEVIGRASQNLLPGSALSIRSSSYEDAASGLREHRRIRHRDIAL